MLMYCCLFPTRQSRPHHCRRELHCCQCFTGVFGAFVIALDLMHMRPRYGYACSPVLRTRQLAMFQILQPTRYARPPCTRRPQLHHRHPHASRSYLVFVTCPLGSPDPTPVDFTIAIPLARRHRHHQHSDSLFISSSLPPRLSSLTPPSSHPYARPFRAAIYANHRSRQGLHCLCGSPFRLTFHGEERLGLVQRVGIASGRG
ncbi:hypothetical protein BJ138DRAFT_438235 [Hygrophoropsis aurantiaca]|uniref:Uncharacterized protein n=1 Tax=Hygrophoropsis aurantiaca TaxID=72124 RepID=A0ACB8A436_9AGAM|nr:hypothetical protein BJ138DRAFT_438235 [Hygrophoropsis aurantiaca]